MASGSFSGPSAETVLAKARSDNPISIFFDGLANDFMCLGTRGRGMPAEKYRIRDGGALAGVSVHVPMQVTQDVLSQIKTLGGEIARTLESASHVVVPCGLSEVDLRTYPRLAQALQRCRELGTPIAVETTWIEEVARHATWHVVLQDAHVPPLLALLEPEDEKRDVRGGSSGGGGGVAAASDVRIQMPPHEATRRGTPPSAHMSASASAHVARPQLASSLAETYSFLREKAPEQLEDEQLAKAIENSLLDFALQLRVDRGEASSDVLDASRAAQVLGLEPSASAAEVRAAYRRLALKVHPDRGGSSAAFLTLQRAYKVLMRALDWAEGGGTTDGEGGGGPGGGGGGPSGEAGMAALPGAAGRGQELLTGPRIDLELREHRALVEAWFEREGADLEAAVTASAMALDALGLEVVDVGATNRNERGETMLNQCFYLSLARAYLREGEKGAAPARHLIEETALHFKRVVEAAVLRAHPEWAGTQVGDELQAFSDFLFFVLSDRSHALLSELAIAVFDSTSGAVEVFRGVHYPDGGHSQPPQQPPQRHGSVAEQRANLLCLHYVPGHYQALVMAEVHGSARGPTLAELLATLDAYAVRFVLTDG